MCIITEKESNPNIKEAMFVKAYEGRKDPNTTFFDDSNMSTTLENFPKLTIIAYQDMLRWVFVYLVLHTTSILNYSRKLIVYFFLESITSIYKLHHQLK